jgi:hypothetical protein
MATHPAQEVSANDPIRRCSAWARSCPSLKWPGESSAADCGSVRSPSANEPMCSGSDPVMAQPPKPDRILAVKLSALPSRHQVCPLDAEHQAFDSTLPQAPRQKHLRPAQRSPLSTGLARTSRSGGSAGRAHWPTRRRDALGRRHREHVARRGADQDYYPCRGSVLLRLSLRPLPATLCLQGRMSGPLQPSRRSGPRPWALTHLGSATAAALSAGRSPRQPIGRAVP